MNELTEKEKLAMKTFVEDEFFENGLESILWADVFSDSLANVGIKGKARSGVLSSLNQKGYLSSDSGSRESTLSLTPMGKEYVKAIFNIKE